MRRVARNGLIVLLVIAAVAVGGCSSGVVQPPSIDDTWTPPPEAAGISPLSCEEIGAVFAYDPQAPLDIPEVSRHREEGVTVIDLTYASPMGGRVPATLVLPDGPGPFAGMLYQHGMPSTRQPLIPAAVTYARMGARSDPDYGLAHRRPIFAEVVSTCLVLVGVYPTVSLLITRYIAFWAAPFGFDLFHLPLWGTPCLAALAGTLVTSPFHLWMLRRVLIRWGFPPHAAGASAREMAWCRKGALMLMSFATMLGHADRLRIIPGGNPSRNDHFSHERSWPCPPSTVFTDWKLGRNRHRRLWKRS